jgi:uncharacterized protein with HEPN domain
VNARPGRHSRQRLVDTLAAVARIKHAEQQLIRAEQTDDEVGALVAFDAVLYNLVVIGEAVNALPSDLTESHPKVPWRDVVDMRNFLSHEYFRVLAEVVRRTIDEPLDQLRNACEQILAKQGT